MRVQVGYYLMTIQKQVGLDTLITHSVEVIM